MLDKENDNVKAVIDGREISFGSGKRKVREELKKKALRRAIREKCLDCCCWQIGEVVKCNIQNCSLWPYRLNMTGYAERDHNNE